MKEIRIERQVMDDVVSWDICFDTRFKDFESTEDFQSIHNLRNCVSLDHYLEKVYQQSVYHPLQDLMVEIDPVVETNIIEKVNQFAQSLHF